MSPRFQKLASDWKTYVALIAAAGTAASALTDLVKKATESFTVLKDLPEEMRWGVAGVLLVVTVVFLLSALSRRSILLEPKRFLLSSEDPEHLVGREEEIDHLAGQCDRHALVFLTGDSGSGKSSLVRAGLAHSLRSGDASIRTGQDLVPIVVDLSGLGWQQGLSLALARELGKLPEEVWAALGGGDRPAPPDLFPWIRNRPLHSPRRLLFILDQFDDYLAVHRSHFYAGTTLRRPGEIEALNPDWHGLGELLRDGRLSLLVVTRSDAAPSLPALSFVEEASIAREHLTRLEPNLVAPLLSRLTEPVDGRPVVSDPEFGWHQIRSRLLRDLKAAGDGQVLPIQLAVALNSLRLVRSLTVAEYERNGGLRGLERLHVERHAEKAATAARVLPGAVIDALRTLVSPDGSKTQPVVRADFEAVLSGRGASGDAAGRAVTQLEDDRLLRRVLGEGEPPETLLLYHDYLARGVREAHRQANLWTELLRERAQSYQEAIGWRQRWRALLSPVEQCRILWERRRKDFSFNDKRGFVGLSTVRWLPIALVLLLLGAGGQRIDSYRKEQIAAQVLNLVGHNNEIMQEEAVQLRRLETEERATAARALYLAAEDPVIALRASRRVEVLVALAIGLDPGGDRSRALVTKLVVPVLQDSHTGSSSAVFAAQVASRLHLTPTLAKQVASPLAARAKAETDSFALARMGSALARLDGVENRQIVPAAEALIDRLKTDLGPLAVNARSEMSTALLALTEKLERRDAQPLAAALIQQMKGSPDDLELLAQILVNLRSKLDREQIRSAADLLIMHMKASDNGYEIARSGSLFGELVEELDSRQVRPAAEILISRLRSETDLLAIPILASALGTFGTKLDGEQIRPVADTLITFMRNEQDPLPLSYLGSILGRFGTKMDRGQSEAAAQLVVVRMKAAPSSFYAENLAQPLTTLSTNLEPRQVAPLAQALVERMTNEPNPGSLASLGRTLATLGEKLEGPQIRSGAEILIERMTNDPNPLALGPLGSALGALKVLESWQTEPLAQALVSRMNDEHDNFALASLGSALAALSTNLENQEIALRAFDKLDQAALGEWQSRALARLVEPLVTLGARVPPTVALSAYPRPVRIEQVYVDLLKSPFVPDTARTELLKGLERATGQTFSGDLWKFVDWATQTEAGRALGLGLDGPPPEVPGDSKPSQSVTIPPGKESP